MERLHNSPNSIAHHDHENYIPRLTTTDIKVSKSHIRRHWRQREVEVEEAQQVGLHKDSFLSSFHFR